MRAGHCRGADLGEVPARAPGDRHRETADQGSVAPEIVDRVLRHLDVRSLR